MFIKIVVGLIPMNQWKKDLSNIWAMIISLMFIEGSIVLEFSSGKYVFEGNWKMNAPSFDAKVFGIKILRSINDINNVGNLVYPPFTSIVSTKEALRTLL